MFEAEQALRDRTGAITRSNWQKAQPPMIDCLKQSRRCAIAQQQ
jgi:hypothetical protein